MPRSIISITDGSLKLADDELGLATGDAFECQVTDASIQAVPVTETVPATWCEGESSIPGKSGWQIVINWLQDWRDSAGGLSGYAFTNEAALKWFEMKLDQADTEPVATGQCYIAAGNYGGAANTPLPATATWPLAAKPTITLPTAAATEAA
jgi:hypothetical protein